MQEVKRRSGEIERRWKCIRIPDSYYIRDANKIVHQLDPVMPRLLKTRPDCASLGDEYEAVFISLEHWIAGWEGLIERVITRLNDFSNIEENTTRLQADLQSVEKLIKRIESMKNHFLADCQHIFALKANLTIRMQCYEEVSKEQIADSERLAKRLKASRGIQIIERTHS